MGLPALLCRLEMMRERLVDCFARTGQGSRYPLPAPGILAATDATNWQYIVFHFSSNPPHAALPLSTANNKTTKSKGKGGGAGATLGAWLIARRAPALL